MRPKDTVGPAKQDDIVNKTLYECGKVYIGETGTSIQKRIIERDRDIRLASSQETGHYPIWMEVKLINRDPHWYTCSVNCKEAIHTRLHPNSINEESGIEIPQSWMTTIKEHKNRKTIQQTMEQWEDRNAKITATSFPGPFPWLGGKDPGNEIEVTGDLRYI